MNVAMTAKSRSLSLSLSRSFNASPRYYSDHSIRTIKASVVVSYRMCSVLPMVVEAIGWADFLSAPAPVAAVVIAPYPWAPSRRLKSA